MVNRELSTKNWYDEYYNKVGRNRNDLRTNKGVLMQTLATEKAVVRAFYDLEQDPAQAKVLDVGCGGGGDLFQLLRMGYKPERITGIDILEERIDAAKRLYPQVNFIQGDASQLQYANDTFDLVFESTMFVSLPDDTLSSGIASEMIRVCKPNGYIMLVDWRTPKPGDTSYKALTGRRLHDMFEIGSKTRLVGTYRGALVPPLGRRLSKSMPSLYFTIAAICPMLVGQVVYLLQTL